MVIMTRAMLLSCCLTILTGCPGYGDILLSDKEAVVSMEGQNVCFWVKGYEKYKPVLISISPRGVEYGKVRSIINPPLISIDNKWCVTPSFYAFPNQGQYIVMYGIAIGGASDRIQRVVSGVELSNGHVRNFHLTDMEIMRPYNEIE